VIYIGVDPGKTGGIAVFKDAVVAELIPMPIAKAGKKMEIDEKLLVQKFSSYVLWPRCPNGVRAYVELVGARPGQGVTSMFSFGTGWGLVRGMLAALMIPYELVRPQAWKKVMMAGQPKGSEYHVASRLWPKIEWPRTPKSKQVLDGVVDAALICEYGRRCHLGEK